MRNQNESRGCAGLIGALTIVLAATLTVAGQDQSQYDHGTPPQHAAGVSSFGSYLSTDLGTINLTNGALNLKVPTGDIGGRGFWFPLSLNYSNKVWSSTLSSAVITDTGGPGQRYPVAYAAYDDPESRADFYQYVGPGWTIGSAPVLRVRGMGINSTNNPACGGTSDYIYVLVKLTLILPDKGEIELRDDLTDGEPSAGVADSNGCRTMSASRGRRWHATDGSGTVFVSDVDNGVVNGDLNGTVITGDGMRYRFTSTTSRGGPAAFLRAYADASSVTDRNGNVLNINYPSSTEVQYVDQLDRITLIDFNAQDPDNPGQTVAVLVTLPGYQGNNRYYKIKTDTMNLHYRSDINPTLPVINGDNDPEGYGYGWQGPHTSLFPQSYGSGAQRIDDQIVVSQVVLPDGRALSFNYNEFGEVAEVVTPTGGTVQYDYAYSNQLPSGNSAFWEVRPSTRIPSDVSAIDRAVMAKRTYADGSTLESSWSYAYAPQTAPNGTSYAGTEVQVFGANNAVILDQMHFFMANQRFLTWTNGQAVGTGYSLWSTGIELRGETRDTSGAVLMANEEDWTQRTAVSWSTYPTEQIANDNRVNETRTFLDNGSVAKVDTLYQASVSYNNPADVRAYDYDQSLKRRTLATYADSNNLINGVDYTADSIHLLSLPLMLTLYDANNNQMAQTTNEYDNYANDGGNHAPLQDYSAISQHDSNYSVGNTTRGNVTATGRWLNLNNSVLYTYSRYDTVGNAVSVTDARSNVAAVSFVDNFGDGSHPLAGASGTIQPTYALPTLITSPPPNPGEPQQTAHSQYDFSTGLLVGFADRNGVITQTLYNDKFDRPTQIKAALGSPGVETHIAMYYAPTTALGTTLTGNDVLTAKDQNSLDDQTLRSWTHTDGFGRTIQNWMGDPQGNDEVITVYDALGRVSRKSNPFRPSLSESPVYTTSVYDLAGRVTSVTTPDNSAVTSAYSGNTVTVADQNGKARKSVTDALGRLTSVYEDRSGLNYQTSYGYDALDDLLNVNQGSQTRTFVYDSLKRLSSATNPESGTIGYQYDNNGNLTQKTDARGVVTTYVYDALNRSKTVGYSDGTPTVTRSYDNQTVGANGKGRLWTTQTAGNAGMLSTTDTYDALGRPLTAHQQFYNGISWSQSFSLGSTYDLAGEVLSQSYPATGRSVNYTYNAAGRTNSFTGTLGDGASRTYATGISYSDWGSLSQEQYGTATAVYSKLLYNSRGQLAEIRAGTTSDATNWNRGKIINDYSSQCAGAACNGTDNNGNLKQQEMYIPANDQMSSYTSWYQQYTYDSLNRLTQVHETTGNSSLDWQQAYVYDRYGNRTINSGGTWGGNPSINSLQTWIDPGNNRLYSSGDQNISDPNQRQVRYDAAGNQTQDNYSPNWQGTRIYDAENRMVRVTDTSNIIDTYTYDGDGHRVRRNLNGTETWQVYGLDGELLAEYAVNAAPTSPQKEYGYRNGQLLVTLTPPPPGTNGGLDVRWLVTDQLGTPRMIFDNTGSLANVSRHDYLPFGEELTVNQGLRTAALGYATNDGERQQFTRKERDNETGLDYFNARYHASIQGRFTSPDPVFFQKEMLLDPQRFNLYAYVRNNPLKLVDPNGLAIELTGDEAERKRKLELLRQSVGKEAGAYLYENKDKDGKYYVGIYTNGPDGKSKAFEQVNSVAGDVAKVIRDTFVAQIQIVPAGTQVKVEGGLTTIGKVDRINGDGPGASYVDEYGRATIYLMDPKGDLGSLPANLSSDGKEIQFVLSDVLAHEMGHVEARWGYVTGPSNTNAVDLENRARRLRDPNAPIRTGHESPLDAVGPQPFIINVRPGTQGNWKP